MGNLNFTMETKRKKLKSYFSSCTKLNSKQAKGLKNKNRYPETLKEKVENTLQPLGTAKDLLNETPGAQEVRAAISKWDLRKFKSFFQQRKALIQ